MASGSDQAFQLFLEIIQDTVVADFETAVNTFLDGKNIYGPVQYHYDGTTFTAFISYYTV